MAPPHQDDTEHHRSRAEAGTARVRNSGQAVSREKALKANSPRNSPMGEVGACPQPIGAGLTSLTVAVKLVLPGESPDFLFQHCQGCRRGDEIRTPSRHDD